MLSERQSQIIDDYGSFQQSDIFSKHLFQKFDILQLACAEKIVSSILQYANGNGRFPKITTIIDYGCGNGQLLLSIFQEYKRCQASDKNIFRFIGIDPCHNSIKMAEEALKKLGRIETPNEIVFMHTSSESQLANMKYINWDETAVLCLCHTWFHILNQKSLINEINNLRPGLIVIDVFRTWDKVVGELNGSEIGEFEEEEYRIGPHWHPDKKSQNCIYALRTEVAEVASDNYDQMKVFRGIYCYENLQKEDGKWLFRTIQVAKLSSELFHMEEKDARPEIVVERNRTNGELCGKCNYLILDEFYNNSGWGPMKCTVLGALSNISEVYNSAYFEVVSGMVRNLLNSENKEFSNIHDSLSIYGKGEVAIILPFDGFRPFTRFIALYGTTDEQDKTLNSVMWIVEELNPAQTRFPTATGIYHTMVDSVSCPIAIPMQAEKDYLPNFVDRAANAIENAFLEKVSSDYLGWYFVMPFYYGTLPLFSLIVKTPAEFNIKSTSSQLYNELAANVNANIRAKISGDYIYVNIIRKLAMKLWANTNSKIERDLFGDSFKCQFKSARKHTWKSWILTMPSLEVKNSIFAEQQNKQLDGYIENSLKFLEKNTTERISNMFLELKFFSDELHDNIKSEMRKMCFDQLKDKSGGLIDIANQASFRDGIENYLQKFDYVGENVGWKQFVAYHLYRVAIDENEDSFQILKAAFCRNLENSEDGKDPYRFSVRRLYAWLCAASFKEPLDLDKMNFNELLEFDLKYGAENYDNRTRSDVLIEETLNLINDIEKLHSLIKNVTVYPVFNARDEQIEIEVKVACANLRSVGGQFTNKQREFCNRFYDNLVELEEHEFHFNTLITLHHTKETVMCYDFRKEIEIG